MKVNPLSIGISVSYSVGVWKIRTLGAIQMIEDWLVKFQREV